jgi:hypothetical protein
MAGALAYGCGGGEPAAPPPEVKEAKAVRDIVDGVAQVRSTVTVLFDRDFKVIEGKVPLASRFEFAMPSLTGGPGTRRVFVKTVERQKDNPRAFTLSVDAVLPIGTKLSVERAAFQEGAQGAITADVTSEFTPAFALLATTALQPTAPGIVDSAKQAPLKPEDRDPGSQRAALAKHLDQRATGEQAKQAALQRFDSIPPEVVPSPKLRAALAALTGTFAEPALDSLFTANNCGNRPVALIAFQAPPGNPNLLGRSVRQRDGRRVISINPIVEGERFEYLVPLVAHEAIHCDNADGRYEEIAATAFDAFLYLQLLSLSPDLALGGTVMTRELNIDAIAFINSGRTYPESVGVLPSMGVSRVLPGSNVTAKSFAEVVAAAYPDIQENDSPEEPLAKAYADVLRKASGAPAGPVFNLGYLDQLLGTAMDPRVITAAVSALGLAGPGQ